MKKELIDLDKLSRKLLSQLGKRKKLVRIPKNRELFKGKLEESAVLLLSDIHVGKINYFLDLESEKGEAIETYNPTITIHEMNRLVESIYSLNQLLAAGYKIKKLYIFGLGDLVDNDIIVSGQRFFIEVGVGAQLMLAVKLLQDLITELLKMFDEIEFVLIGGNHGRMTARREVAPFYNNFDYLLGKILDITFKEEPRVTIISPEAWFHVHRIYDWKYLLHHGNTVYSWMGFPYYGLVRAGRSRRTEIDIDIECIGHFHQRMEIPISSSSYTLVNGCWIPKDDFGWRQYGILSHPEQIYFGVSPKRPRTWCFNIDLLPHASKGVK